MDISKKMAKIAFEALEDKKGNDIKVLNIEKITTIADYFIIVSGDNVNQVQALADNVQDKLHEAGYDARAIEGYQSANWILLDYQDIIIHVFNREDRLFYDIERIWRDGIETTFENEN